MRAAQELKKNYWLNAENGLQERAHQDDEQRSVKPRGYIGRDALFAHLPVIVNPNRAEQTKDGREDQTAIDRTKKRAGQVILDRLHFADTRLGQA